MFTLPKYLTTEEVQKFFRKKSRRTIYNWINQGKFPNAKKIGKEFLIPETDVLEIVKTLENSDV